ncbi:MAG: GTPase HflX [Christensenellales bacterium]|jgi:GTP-binding protein HflX
MINGNITGIKNSLLQAMEELYDMRFTRDEFATDELLQRLANFTQATNREICVYIARDGMLMSVYVGDANTVELPQLSVRHGVRRLSGIRCIHTHPNGSALLSAPDLSSLKKNRFDSIMAVGVRNGKPVQAEAAYLMDKEEILRTGILSTRPFPNDMLMDMLFQSDRLYRNEGKEKVAERAVLVGIEDSRARYDSIGELEELAKTAGAVVLHKESQKRFDADNAYYVGKGKVKELALLCQSIEADICIFDDELSMIQLRNLERELGVKVVDRATLILDIFAARATTSEGKLQVELAQMKYKLPRLLGSGQILSRLGGGIGTRGPGEKKLEVDRRRIRRRIFELEKEIKRLKQQRDLRRERRNEVPTIALVGYTNAGKSTLLNTLSGSDVTAEDKLFATLDPVTRKINLPSGTMVLLVDTVGFINKLPHDLIDAFRSTLEEAIYADILLHVVDASADYYEEQMKVVQNVLADLGAGHKPMITAMNKMDEVIGAVSLRKEDVPVSAKTGQGCDALLQHIEDKLSESFAKCMFDIPYAKGSVAAFLRKNGSVLEEEYLENGLRLSVMTNRKVRDQALKMLQ